MQGSLKGISALAESKVCTSCGQRKPMAGFSNDPAHKDGRRSHCRACISDYNRAHYAGHARKRRDWKGYGTARGQMKTALYAWQAGECAGCQEPFLRRNLEIDRIVPKARGGKYEWGNVQLLCNWCNPMKGNRSQEWFLNHLRELGVIQ